MHKKEPKIIKRYQNRKLYDTVDSCYVTLEDISDMIKQGEEVQIVDNRKKEDITAMTLAQIIFEEQKRKTNVMPLGLLTQIIRSSGSALRELLARTIETGVREIGTVREFVDEKLKPTMESVQHLPSLQSEIHGLKEKIQQLEQKLSRSRQS